MAIETSNHALFAQPGRAGAPQKLSQTHVPQRPEFDRFDDALLLAEPAKKSRMALPSPAKNAARTARRAAAHVAGALAPLAPYAVAAGTVACLIGAARGYACTGYDKSATQNFINANGTLFGYVHGWFSDCYEVNVPCGQSCSNNVCTTVYCPETFTDKTPSDYVSAVANAVKSCGFSLVSNIPPGAATRVANALIEKNRWVKIVVNQLNLTDVTDPSVLCLHGIQ